LYVHRAGQFFGNYKTGDKGEVTMKKTLLLVDDDESVLQVVSSLLQDEGYTVLEATNGQAALSLMADAMPDLIVSDALMPGMDGFTFCQQVRANSQWSQIPFIFLTGKGERSDIRHGMGLGADDYLTKPLDVDDLLSAVEVRLARASEARGAIDRASADLRDTMLRMLTHEFRTPLTLIIGYIDLINAQAEGSSDEEFLSFLSGLRTGSERLANLVEDLLLLSKLQTGALSSEALPLPGQMAKADSVLGHVTGRFATRAAARNMELAVRAGAPEAIVVLDEGLLMDLVCRLVDNAIKFSRDGRGQVIVSTRQEEGFWVLDVADKGIGIHEEALSFIFEPFYQVDRHRMEQQGAGLGLAIVRGLAELGGGRVDVASEPGRGSTFTVRLPLAAL
jgi:two-component system sensor histidine kinase/response regulator